MRIQTKIQVGFISAFLILALSIMTFTYLFMESHFEQQEGNRLKTQTRNSAKSIDDFMQTRVADFNVLSNNPLFSISSNEVITEYLARVVKQYPFYDNLFFVNKKGNIISSSNKKFIGLNILQLEPDIKNEFKKTINGGNEDVYISNLSKISQKEIDKNLPLDIELLSDVIEENGNLVGVLVGFINMKSLNELIFDIDHKVFKNENTFLLNNKGEVLLSNNQKLEVLQLHPDLLIPELQQKIKSVENDFYVYENLKGVKVISGYTNLSTYGTNNVGNWSLLTIVPYNEVMMPIYQLIFKAFIFVLFLLLIMVVFLIIFSRKFIKPIVELDKAVSSFKTYRKPLNLKITSKDEIGNLYMAFNKMTERVSSSYIIENKLAKEEEMHRLFADYSNDLICLQEPDSTFKYISPSIKSILGYEVSEFLGKKVFSIVHKEDLQPLKDEMEKRANGDKIINAFSFRVQHKEGHFVWLEFSSTPIYKEEKISYFVTSVKDITERILAEQKIKNTLKVIKENEYSLKEAGRLAKIGYWSYHKQTNEIFWSEAKHQIYGSNPEKPVPKIETVLNVFTEESRKKLQEAIETIATKGTPFDIVLEMTNFNNEKRWIRNIGEPIFDDKNEIIGRRGIIQDITERKIAQKAIDYQNEKLNLLNDALNQAQKLSHTGSWHWDMATDKAEWSDEMYNIYGVTKETFNPSNENVAKMVLPEDLHLIERGINSLLIDKTFVPFEFRIKRASGEIRNLYIVALEKNSLRGIFGVTKDITERKKIEEKNVLITERFRNLFDNASVSIWNGDFSLFFEQIEELRKLKISNIKVYLDQNPEVLLLLLEKLEVNKVNKATLKLFKVKNREEFIENIRLTFSSGSDKVFKKFIECLWNNEKTFTSEVNFKTLNGDPFVAIISLPIPQTIREQKTVPISIQSIQNIKDATSAKRKSLDKLNEAQKLAKIGSWFFTPSTKEVEWSEETFRIYGLDPKKGVPDFDTLVSLIHKDDKEFVLEAIAQGKPFDIEHKINVQNNEQKWIRSICKPILDDKDQLISLSGTYQDITQMMLAKKEIVEYQTSLQKLTTEITMIEEKQKHEIATNIHDHLSQSLVISIMRITELKRNPALKLIDEDLKFIESHVSDALENSRKITFELSPPILYRLGIIDALNWLLEDLEAAHKIEFRMITHINQIELDDLKSILLYRSIQEVLTNAIKHAKASLVTLTFDKEELGVNILIVDNGVGFDTSNLNNHRNHSGSGSGFGLFTVQERIRNIQGEFTITSEINTGTTVKIFIPLNL